MAVPNVSSVKLNNQELSKYLGFAPYIVVTLLWIGILLFIVWPKYGEVRTLQESNSQLEEQVSSLESKAEILRSLSSRQSLLETQLGAADQLLPSNKEAFRIIRQIETAVSDSGVLLDKLDTAPGKVSNDDVEGQTAAPAPAPAQVPQTPGAEAGNSSFLGFSISITGSYPSFLQFMKNTLLITRVVTINGLSVSSSSEGSSVISATMRINAYWQQLPTTLGSIESPIESLTQSEEDLLTNVTLPEKISSEAPSQVPTGKSDIFSPF